MTKAARVEFHPNRGKLKVLGVMLSALAAFLLWHALTAPAAVGALPAVILLGLAAALAFKAAADPRPALAVDAEGLEDRVHGRVPWSDVAFYRAQAGLTPGFGWSLKPGRAPERNPLVFRAQAFGNLLTGLPQRSYRRKLLLASPAQMAAACREIRPDLEHAG